MSKAIRNSLKVLRREFKRASKAFLPLYHEEIFVYGEDPINREMWQTFLKANPSESWTEWDGPDDLDNERRFGRFFGNPEGLEEFKMLAESGFLIFRKINKTASYQDHHGWLKMLHEISFYYPTLFHDYSKIWKGSVNEKTPDGLPMYHILAQDLFTCSITAIDLILKLEGLLVAFKIPYHKNTWNI
jgi:hypothetical protein